MANFKPLVALVASITACAATLVESHHQLSVKHLQAFADFSARFGKSYSSQEEADRRLKLFAETDERIRAYNAEHGDMLGHNVFSDWTEQEYKQLLKQQPMNSTKASPEGTFEPEPL